MLVMLTISLYNLTAFSSANSDPPTTLLKHTPVGPVTGAVLGVLVVVALGLYCYKHGRARGSPSSGSSGAGECGTITDRDNYVYHELPALPGPSNGRPISGV